MVLQLVKVVLIVAAVILALALALAGIGAGSTFVERLVEVLPHDGATALRRDSSGLLLKRTGGAEDTPPAPLPPPPRGLALALCNGAALTFAVAAGVGWLTWLALGPRTSEPFAAFVVRAIAAPAAASGTWAVSTAIAHCIVWTRGGMHAAFAHVAAAKLAWRVWNGGELTLARARVHSSVRCRLACASGANAPLCVTARRCAGPAHTISTAPTVAPVSMTPVPARHGSWMLAMSCLLYTSDAADE